MDAILVKPKSKAEFNLILKLLKKMDIQVLKMTEDKLEDFGMLHLMKSGSRTKVSAKKIKQILK